MLADSPEWSVYIIEASDGSFYTGITTDVQRRWREHLGTSKGAKYFRGRSPKRVVYIERQHSRRSASQREAQIKRWPRREKLLMVQEFLASKQGRELLLRLLPENGSSKG